MSWKCTKCDWTGKEPLLVALNRETLSGKKFRKYVCVLCQADVERIEHAGIGTLEAVSDEKEGISEPPSGEDSETPRGTVRTLTKKRHTGDLTEEPKEYA